MFWRIRQCSYFGISRLCLFVLFYFFLRVYVFPHSFHPRRRAITVAQLQAPVFVHVSRGMLVPIVKDATPTSTTIQHALSVPVQARVTVKAPVQQQGRAYVMLAGRARNVRRVLPTIFRRPK